MTYDFILMMNNINLQSAYQSSELAYLQTHPAPLLCCPIDLSKTDLDCIERLQRSVRVNEHFGIPILSHVKLAVGHFRIVDGDLMRDDEARLGLAGNDELSRVSVVRFDIALTSRERQALQRVSSCTMT